MAPGKWRRIGYNEARVHASIMAAVGWTILIAFESCGRGDYSMFGSLKWADFVHFYTLGSLARANDGSILYDSAGQHAYQTLLVPASINDWFVPVYGPQTALFFAPLTLLPYFAAGLAWAAVTLTVYLWTGSLAWRPARDVLNDRAFVLIAALAFPPLFRLVGYGQTTAVVLLAFTGGWRAYRAGRPMLAGLALSLLTIKPQFGLVLAPLAIASREFRVVAGILLGIGLQALAVLSVFDATVFAEYGAVIKRLPSLTALLEPRAYEMHSLSALTRLLPSPASILIWAILSTAVIAATIVVWRQVASSRVRFGALVLASALVNPHLSTYDATVLALPILWLGGWLLERQPDTAWFWQRVYWISAALFIPTAALLKVQLSTLLVGELFGRFMWIACAERRPALAARET